MLENKINIIIIFHFIEFCKRHGNLNKNIDKDYNNNKDNSNKDKNKNKDDNDNKDTINKT